MEKSMDEIAFTFFRFFARFEYALKETGHLIKDDKRAMADWNSYAYEVATLLSNPPEGELKQAIAYIFDNPPKRQKNRQGVLTWEHTKSNSQSPKDLLDHVKCVRNNLFHGGKESDWAHSERNVMLIESSLTILTHCLKESKDLSAQLKKLD